ncbi:MAG: glutamine-hydrolyzing GMP synthase, partial [Candidatus Humimicrobiaceae bacterium]
MKNSSIENIIVLDFGGQYSQLIARRVRELRVFSELVPYDTPFEKIKAKNPKGIILSGSPYSISANEKKYVVGKELFKLGIPVLGICYGMQLIAYLMDGDVASSRTNEYGKTKVNIDTNSFLFDGLQSVETCWMSHRDSVSSLPPFFKIIASTTNL